MRFHAVARLCDQARLAALGVAPLRDVLGRAFVLDHDEVVAGIRHARQAKHLHRNGRTGTFDLRTGFVEQCRRGRTARRRQGSRPS
jgi:hypothetical protein